MPSDVLEELHENGQVFPGHPAHFQRDLPCTGLRALLEKVIGNAVTYTKCTKREMMSVL